MDASPNVLLILGHPREESLSYALGEAFEEGARQAGASVRRLALAQLEFDPHVRASSPRKQAFEEDVCRARRLIQWADHLVFVYPTWWGTVPALLKGFIDRVFTSGFAFNEIEGGTGYEPLLTGKSARLITTRDTPGWVYRWIYRQPGHNAMKRTTLGFCGVEPVRISSFGPVRDSRPAEREQWLNEVRQAGRRLRGGARSRWDRLRRKGRAWLKAVRLQFYPMTWVAYTAGAFGAASQGYSFNDTVYWIGYVCLFLLEMVTVLSNDYFDIESDRKNEHFSPFTGGSRVLVDSELSFRELRAGMAVASALTAAAAGGVLWSTTASALPVLICLLVLGVLALGYTVPPLKLSHRGLGEVDVGLTHSFGVVVAGYLFQGGAWQDAFPWLLSVPLFLAVLPAIILSGVPDYEADKAASKNTLVVKLGRPMAIRLAMVLALLAAGTGLAWQWLGPMLGAAGAAYDGIVYLALPHAALLITLLRRHLRRDEPPARIDRLMALALMYILWFGVVPLVRLV